MSTPFGVLGVLGAVGVLIAWLSGIILFFAICGIYSRLGQTNRLLARMVAQQEALRTETVSMHRNLAPAEYAAEDARLAIPPWAKYVFGVGGVAMLMLLVYANLMSHK